MEMQLQTKMKMLQEKEMRAKELREPFLREPVERKQKGSPEPVAAHGRLNGRGPQFYEGKLWEGWNEVEVF